MIIQNVNMLSKIKNKETNEKLLQWMKGRRGGRNAKQLGIQNLLLLMKNM